MREHKNPVICYCAGITREEIRQAVMMGARREEEVRIITGKTQQGLCHEKHPQGTGCQEEFEKEITLALKELEAMARALFGFG